MRLGSELVVRSLHNRIHRTGLLTETTVDALGHINIVPGGSSSPVLTGLGLDGNGLGRADGLAELAGDTTLVACWISPQGVFPAEAGT